MRRWSSLLLVLPTLLWAMGSSPAHADIPPQPSLSVPAGFTATALTGTPDGLLWSMGFDLSGALLVASSVPFGTDCFSVTDSTKLPHFYRLNADGSFSLFGLGGPVMDVPEDILVPPQTPGYPWPRALYSITSSCQDAVEKYVPGLAQPWQSIGHAAGASPTGGAFGPDGWLYVVDSFPHETNGAGGIIYKYLPVSSTATVAYLGPQGGPFENPISAEFGPAAYGNDLWISDHGRRPSTDDGFMVKFDVTTNAFTVFHDSRKGSHFWREAFAPAGPFQGQLYVINNPMHELDGVSPTGDITPFATWTSNTSLVDVVASPDGQVLYALMSDQTTGTNTIYRIAGADTTPPSLACGAADGLWHAGNVSIACTATDAGSGLANLADASFSLTTTVPAGTETASAETGMHTVCDRAGNCATAGPIGGNRIDRQPPTISLNSPAGGPFLLGQTVTASYSCTDGGSGVASCAGPVASGAPVDTSSAGIKTFRVDASDAVGNAASSSSNYEVTFGVTPLFDEAKQFGGHADIELALCDAAGGDVSASSVLVDAVALDGSPYSASVSFRQWLEGGGAAYVLGLHTRDLAAGTHTLTFTASGDPLTHTVSFEVR